MRLNTLQGPSGCGSRTITPPLSCPSPTTPSLPLSHHPLPAPLPQATVLCLGCCKSALSRGKRAHGLPLVISSGGPLWWSPLVRPTDPGRDAVSAPLQRLLSADEILTQRRAFLVAPPILPGLLRRYLFSPAPGPFSPLSLPAPFPSSLALCAWAAAPARSAGGEVCVHQGLTQPRETLAGHPWAAQGCVPLLAHRCAPGRWRTQRWRARLRGWLWNGRSSRTSQVSPSCIGSFLGACQSLSLQHNQNGSARHGRERAPGANVNRGTEELGFRERRSSQ